MFQDVSAEDLSECLGDPTPWCKQQFVAIWPGRFIWALQICSACVSPTAMYASVAARASEEATRQRASDEAQFDEVANTVARDYKILVVSWMASVDNEEFHRECNEFCRDCFLLERKVGKSFAEVAEVLHNFTALQEWKTLLCLPIDGSDVGAAGSAAGQSHSLYEDGEKEEDEEKEENNTQAINGPKVEKEEEKKEEEGKAGGATRRVRPRREEEQPSQASGPSAGEGDNDTTTTTHAEGKKTDAATAPAEDLKEQKATIASWASLIQATEVTTEGKDQEAIAVMLADLEAQKDTIDTWLSLAQALTEEPTENKTKEIKDYLAKAMHDAKKLLDQMKGKQ